ncbi:hypothetical protein [Petrachloros mirabilis]
MSQDTNKGLAVIQRQLKELDEIFRDTIESLNTVSGMERVAKWRKHTIAMLSESVGQQAAQDFARVQPGPSFTNDLVEEFTDFIETFKTPLTALSQKLSKAGSDQPGGG